jgi:hypothetical protein
VFFREFVRSERVERGVRVVKWYQSLVLDPCRRFQGPAAAALLRRQPRGEGAVALLRQQLRGEDAAGPRLRQDAPSLRHPPIVGARRAAGATWRGEEVGRSSYVKS